MSMWLSRFAGSQFLDHDGCFPSNVPHPECAGVMACGPHTVTHRLCTSYSRSECRIAGPPPGFAGAGSQSLDPDGCFP